MQDDIPDIIRQIIYAQENGLLADDVGLAALNVFRAGIDDDFSFKLIQDRVRNNKIAQAFEGPFRLPMLTKGEIVQGIDMRGRSIRFPLQFLNGHSLSIGNTGCGKTTKSKFLILQVALMLVGLWLIDLRKEEFAVLRSYLKRVGVDLIVLPIRKLRLNPLQIPRFVAPAAWAPRVADMLVLALRLPPRATKLVHLTVLELYRRFRCSEGAQRFPTLFDLREQIANQKDANAPARQAVIDSLDPVLLSLGPEVLAFRRGWTTDVLSRRRIVFEMGGVSEADKDLILSSLVLSEFTSRVAQGISNQRMNLFICCDEAARLVSAAGGSNGIVDQIGLVRGTGIGVDFSVLSADVAPAVLSNTANKYIGRCGSATDYETIGAAMGLTAEQRRFLALHLRPGLFVGQLGDGEWRLPFLFKVPALHLSKNPGSSTGIQGALPQIGESSDSGGLDDLLALPVDPAPEFAKWNPERRSQTSERSEDKAAEEDSSLSDAELRFLKAVVEQPGQPSSRYPKQAGIGARLAQKVRKRLVELGFLREHSVNAGGRGRASIILEPLDKAFEAFKKARERGAKP